MSFDPGKETTPISHEALLKLVPDRWPMSDEERALARRLVRCRFAVGSYAKRFARDMASRADKPGAELTFNQHEFLKRMEHLYRRQLAALGR